jgi:hypothetical protein
LKINEEEFLCEAKKDQTKASQPQTK